MGFFVVGELEKMLSEPKWLIFQNEYFIEANAQYETNFTLSNGYMGVRGVFEEGSRREYPGHYIAGIFNKSEAQVRELVNVPNCLGLKVYIEGEEINLDDCEVIDFKRILDMKKGVLFRSTKLKDKKGRITLIEGYRFLSMKNKNRMAIKFFLIPLNYNARVGIESTIDGTVTNMRQNPKLRVKHLKLIENCDLDGKGCYLETATRDDDIRIGIGTALRTYKYSSNDNISKYRRFSAFGEIGMEYSEFDVCQGDVAQIDKYIVLYTSRGVDKKDLKERVSEELKAFVIKGINGEIEEHIRAYEKLWEIADVNIEGDEEADRALRFNIFHLMSSANDADTKVSLGAKALHGEGYKGHVFWDTEIFMLPFFIYVFPNTAKALLMYRYHNLNAARENAFENGFKGAQYPWESADTGKEETPKWGVDYLGNPVRIWTGELEHHINADIAFAIYNYYRATDDLEFMFNYGFEMFLEIARFWASRCQYNSTLDRYEINDVIGPDEFHEHVNNNAYTNYLAKWTIEKAVEFLNWIKGKYTEYYREMASKICLTEEEIKEWIAVADKIYLPFKKDVELIEQFEGYFDKKDFVVERYDENYMPLWPEGIDISRLNDTQLIKQADVVMLMVLLDEEFDEKTKRVNYEYYEKRTMHKSSLSASIYSIMSSRLGDLGRGYRYFMMSANTDLKDTHGNSKEGFHAASAGGTWQAVVFGFGGLHIDKEGILCINPRLYSGWRGLTFRFFWRSNLVEVNVAMSYVRIKLLKSTCNQLNIKVWGNIYLLKQGEDIFVELPIN